MAKRTRALGIFAGAALTASIAVAGAAPQQAAAAAPPIQTTSSGAPATVPALASWTAGTGSFQYTEDTTRTLASAAQQLIVVYLAAGLGGHVLDVGTVGLPTFVPARHASILDRLRVDVAHFDEQLGPQLDHIEPGGRGEVLGQLRRRPAELVTHRLG